MKLIFALGNPEDRYSDTRHNIGFKIANSWLETKGGSFQNKPKLKAELAEVSMGDEKIIVAKPSTYYNLVGESYRAIIDFYKISPEDTLVIHDDIAINLGIVRIRSGGSSGGNNGIKSIIAHGGENSIRLRIGSASQLSSRIPKSNYVLGKLSTSDNKSLLEVYKTALGAIDDFIAGSITQTTINTAKD